MIKFVKAIEQNICLLTIIFFIFDNSHCTHGTSCINNPYYIGDRTQFIGEAKIQLCIGSVANLIH